MTEERLFARIAALEERVTALEARAAAEPEDPIRAGFEAYRGRARQVEDRRERRDEA